MNFKTVGWVLFAGMDVQRGCGGGVWSVGVGGVGCWVCVFFFVFFFVLSRHRTIRDLNRI
jgi:hypothetical protein